MPRLCARKPRLCTRARACSHHHTTHSPAIHITMPAAACCSHLVLLAGLDEERGVQDVQVGRLGELRGRKEGGTGMGKEMRRASSYLWLSVFPGCPPATPPTTDTNTSHLLQPRLYHRLCRVDPLLHRLAPLVGDAAAARHHLHGWAGTGWWVNCSRQGTARYTANCHCVDAQTPSTWPMRCGHPQPAPLASTSSSSKNLCTTFCLVTREARYRSATRCAHLQVDKQPGPGLLWIADRCGTPGGRT